MRNSKTNRQNMDKLGLGNMEKEIIPEIESGEKKIGCERKSY